MNKITLNKYFTLPFQILYAVLIVVLFGWLLPEGLIRYFYSFSVIFKELLGLALPIIVFSFIFSGILAFKKKALLILPVLLITVLISNFFASFFSLICSKPLVHRLIISFDLGSIFPKNVMVPFFDIDLPDWISIGKIVFLAVFLGVLFSFRPFRLVESLLLKLKRLSNIMLKYFFLPLLPFYVFGFLLKIHFEKAFYGLVGGFGLAFLFMLVLQALYLFFVYWLASGYSLRKTFPLMKNALPVYFTGLTTMSSVATIPQTMKFIDSQTRDNQLSSMLTPILANFHFVGDAIFFPVFAMLSAFLFLPIEPSFYTFFIFILYFIFTMFGISAMPGKGVIVVIPVLTGILGFSDVMISVITAFYFLADSFNTGANVMGDGAIAIIINKFLKRRNIIVKEEI